VTSRNPFTAQHPSRPHGSTDLVAVRTAGPGQGQAVQQRPAQDLGERKPYTPAGPPVATSPLPAPELVPGQVIRVCDVSDGTLRWHPALALSVAPKTGSGRMAEVVVFVRSDASAVASVELRQVAVYGTAAQVVAAAEVAPAQVHGTVER